MNLRKTAAAACTQTFITTARQMFMLHLKIPSNEWHGFQKRGLDARKLWKNIHLLKKGLFLTHLSPAFPCPFWTPFSVFVLCNSKTLHKQTDGRTTFDDPHLEQLSWKTLWAFFEVFPEDFEALCSRAHMVNEEATTPKDHTCQSMGEHPFNRQCWCCCCPYKHLLLLLTGLSEHARGRVNSKPFYGETMSISITTISFALNENLSK